jgi:hypothetical protein
MMVNTSLPYRKNPVHNAGPGRVDGLYFLLHYALTHYHSHQWLGPIALLLKREEAANG